MGSYWQSGDGILNLTNRLAKIPFLNRTVKATIAWLPFFVRRTITEGVRSGIRKPLRFSGIYPAFESFPDAVHPPDSTRMEFAQNGLASVKRDEMTGLPILGNQHDLLPLAAAIIGQKVRILDFGGSGGVDYLGLLRAARIEATYCVVETPALCAIGRKLWPEDKRISFCEDMPPITERFDIVYACSSIQYVPDPIALMRQFAEYEPRIILIVYTPFAQRGFVRGQIGVGGNYPSWVVSLPETEALMASVGYRLAFGVTEETLLNVSNFPKEYRVDTMTTLLFVRPAAANSSTDAAAG
jgi:putative methyltransferase (TIGR04325 family)